MPPPVPVDSTTGVLPTPDLPNCSATAVVKGYTVEEPTMRIWSRATAASANAKAPATAAAVDMAMNRVFTIALPYWVIRGGRHLRDRLRATPTTPQAES